MSQKITNVQFSLLLNIHSNKTDFGPTVQNLRKPVNDTDKRQFLTS